MKFEYKGVKVTVGNTLNTFTLQRKIKEAKVKTRDLKRCKWKL